MTDAPERIFIFPSMARDSLLSHNYSGKIEYVSADLYDAALARAEKAEAALATARDDALREIAGMHERACEREEDRGAHVLAQWHKANAEHLRALCTAPPDPQAEFRRAAQVLLDAPRNQDGSHILPDHMLDALRQVGGENG